VLGVPETFEKLAQQAPADAHLVLAEQPIVRSAITCGQSAVTYAYPATPV